MSIVISDGGDSGCKTYEQNCVGISYDGSKIICGGIALKSDIFTYTESPNPTATGTERIPAIFSYDNNTNTWSTKCADIANIIPPEPTNKNYKYIIYDTENQQKKPVVNITDSSDPRIFSVINPNNLPHTLWANIGDNAYMSNDGTVQALAHSRVIVYKNITTYPYDSNGNPILENGQHIGTGISKTIFKKVVKVTNNNISVITIPGESNFLCVSVGNTYTDKEFIIGDTSGTYLFLVKGAALYASDKGVDNFRCITTNSGIFNGIDMGFFYNRSTKTYTYHGGILAGAMSDMINTNLYTIFIVNTNRSPTKSVSISDIAYGLYISTELGHTFYQITNGTDPFPSNIVWLDVIMSKDGKYILALYRLNDDLNNYGIYRSENGTEGMNAKFTNLFTPPLIPKPASSTISDYCMTMSDDGKRMMYIIRNTSTLHYSNDYGVTWKNTSLGLGILARSIKLSGDGKVLVFATDTFYRKTITWPA
jgi:hypothetical protein